jgi:hypothetical protein
MIIIVLYAHGDHLEIQRKNDPETYYVLAVRKTALCGKEQYRTHDESMVQKAHLVLSGSEVVLIGLSLF